MKINYNMSAVIANASLNINEKKFNVSSEKMSSGYKLNHAKDNPSGIAIAKRMDAQLAGIANAKQNASDAISVVRTAEGAISEIQSMVHRMSELAIQAANESKTDSDRDAIQTEIDQLKTEMTRMMNETEFNGKKLLNGDCDLKGYADDSGVKVGYYSDEVPADNYSFTINNTTLDAEGNLPDGSITLGNNFPENASISYKGNQVTVKADNSFEMVFTIADDATGDANGEVNLDITGIGAMRVQIGANEGQVLPIRIPIVSLEAMGIADVDLSTSEGAQEAIEATKQANAYISSIRARIGAYENRLEHTESGLDILDENMTGAYSRLMDVDMAEEMTEYTNMQVLNQAGISVLTQANQRPAEMLQLLQ